MTVAELIEKLKSEDQSAVVIVCDDRGDRYLATDTMRIFAQNLAPGSEVVRVTFAARDGHWPAIEII